MPRDTLSGIAYIHISISHQAKPNSNSSARTAVLSTSMYVARVPKFPFKVEGLCGYVMCGRESIRS